VLGGKFKIWVQPLWREAATSTNHPPFFFTPKNGVQDLAEPHHRRPIFWWTGNRLVQYSLIMMLLMPIVESEEIE
jgi:hypothetical protein